VPAFERYIGIDYSGAQTPSDSLPGNRVYLARPGSSPQEVPPPPSPRKYWTRREIAEWLLHELTTGPAAIVGIDHGFSFPLQYFKRHKLRLDWPEFLVDFNMHWPTHENIYVCFVRDGIRGEGAARTGDRKWRRLTELRARTPKSVFHFDVPGSVATSTHAGLPWLFYLWQNRAKAERAGGRRIHFWPFDGWTPSANSSVIAEAYPALWNKTFPVEGRTRDQQDAFAVAEWLRLADSDGRLQRALNPQLDPLDRATAEIEGWILGVDMARLM
jgi:hypothetical protein